MQATRQELWAEELTEEQTTALIEKAATWVVRRGLEVPAILALEMHKPLAHVGASVAVVGAPFAIPFLGFDRFNDATRLFSKRANVERLIQRIEELRSGEAPPKETE